MSASGANDEQPRDDSQGGDPHVPQPDDTANEQARQTSPQPPSSVINAVRLMFVGAGLSALSIIVTLSMITELRDEIAEGNPTSTSDEVETTLSFVIAGSVVLGLVGIGLWIWMALANRKGREWARVVATVLGGIYVLRTLVSLAQTTGPTIVISLITIVLAVVIIWLLFKGESTAYYKAVSASRRSITGTSHNPAQAATPQAPAQPASAPPAAPTPQAGGAMTAGPVIAAISGLMAVIGSLMPWAQITTLLGTVTTDEMAGSRAIAFMLGLAVLAGSATMLIRPSTIPTSSVLTGVGGTLLAVFGFINAIGVNADGNGASVGGGLYLVIAAGAVAAIGTIVAHRSAS